MLAAIKQFMEKVVTPAYGGAEPSKHDLQLATAALFIEMMLMDDEIKKEERQKIKDSIRSKFQLSDEETNELMDLAEKEVQEATDYFQFTSIINQGFTAEQKIKLVEYLWQVAYVDNQLDPLEEHMVRKIADLLYVSHKDFISTKHKVIKSMQLRDSKA